MRIIFVYGKQISLTINFFGIMIKITTNMSIALVHVEL